ncbi:hypothetical protein KSP40_PGU014723 [Platanthera guangdongensis]|uniref:Uncharacterized protein n=1 Tax=Platanthera guangdongensis TaxID=2320717 RepID=A0ABR2MHC5_9ASPA
MPGRRKSCVKMHPVNPSRSSRSSADMIQCEEGSYRPAAAGSWLRRRTPGGRWLAPQAPVAAAAMKLHSDGCGPPLRRRRLTHASASGCGLADCRWTAGVNLLRTFA